MSTTVPHKGRAHGVMVEEKFRDLLKALLPVMDNDSNRALDRIKDIMVCELNKVAAKP